MRVLKHCHVCYMKNKARRCAAKMLTKHEASRLRTSHIIFHIAQARQFQLTAVMKHLKLMFQIQECKHVIKHKHEFTKTWLP